jgi:hypothetical protein
MARRPKTSTNTSWPRKADRVERIEEILETLAALGKARELAGDRYIAV